MKWPKICLLIYTTRDQCRRYSGSVTVINSLTNAGYTSEIDCCCDVRCENDSIAIEIEREVPRSSNEGPEYDYPYTDCDPYHYQSFIGTTIYAYNLTLAYYCIRNLAELKLIATDMKTYQATIWEVCFLPTIMYSATIVNATVVLLRVVYMGMLIPRIDSIETSFNFTESQTT